MTKDTSEPAFPTQESWRSDGGRVRAGQGITLRDYAAFKAMQGLLANHNFEWPIDAFAHHAYRIADAMMEERNKK